nr:SEC14-like protein 4 [Leptinotarsa decemlineata]
MPPAKIILDDDQKFALMKFRRTVADVLQAHHDDHFLLRWLRARNWNLEAAEKMLRQSMKWRQQWEVDGALKEWKPPDVITLYHPSGTTGFDKDGAPVICVPFVGFDVVGLLHSATRQDLIKMTISILEKNLDMAAKTGENQVVVIFDMEGFNLRQYAWRPVFGGSLCDPDGNPRYTTIVKQGGKVPTSCYLRNLEAPEKEQNREFKSAVIKKGEKLCLHFIVAEEGCFLRWEFKTDGHDIKFGVTLKDEHGVESPVVRHRRVASHQMDESGAIACQAPATYTVTFDNTYSLLRSKKLQYCIFVTQPLDKMNIIPTDEELKDLNSNRDLAATSSTTPNNEVPEASETSIPRE